MGRYRIGRNRQAGRAAVLAAVIFASAMAGPALAQAGDRLPPWPSLAAVPGETELARLERLKSAFPDSGSVRLRLLNAYLQEERPADALREAVELVEHGHVFSPAGQAMLLGLEPTAEQRGLLGLQSANANPIENSRPLAIVPAEVLLVESVWRDPRSGDLFVTSVVSRGLFVRRGEESWARVPLEGAGSLSGLAFDPKAGLLWISSGVAEPTPDPGTAFRGLIAIDPATGAERRRLAAPAGGLPSDLAVGPDGTAYASDPASGAIYAARAGASELEVLVPAGTLRSAQGLAVMSDGGALIVSDYGYGLAQVDLATGKVRRVTSDSLSLLDGIDGLWLWRDRLIGVRNGSRPMRIVELLLSPDRTTVRGVINRETAHPAWTEPVGGNLDADSLIYVATGQWDRFGEGGTPSAERPPVATELRVLPLGGD